MTSVDLVRPIDQQAGEPTTGAEPADSERPALPRHVAIVMDGNRRWARQRGMSEGEGHSAGVDAIRPIVEHAADLGIEALSIYAFSRENWARGNDEVETLFALLEAAIRRETPDLVRQGVRVRILGRLDELPERTRAVDRRRALRDGRRNPHDAQCRVQLFGPLRDCRCRPRVCGGWPGRR